MTEVLKSADRQYPLSAERTISFDDGLTVAQAIGTGIQDLLDIPVGARVVGGEIVVETVWDSGTSAVVDIGDGGDPDRYTASPVDLTTLGRTALVLTGFKYTEEDTIDIDPVLVGADATTGQAYIRVEYVLEDRAHETQGFNVSDYGSKNAPETG